MMSTGGREARTACFSGERKSSSDLCDDAKDWRRAWQIARGLWFQPAGLVDARRIFSASTRRLTSITYLTLAFVASVAISPETAAFMLMLPGSVSSTTFRMANPVGI